MTSKYFFKIGVVLFPGCYLLVEKKKSNLINTMHLPSVGEFCASVLSIYIYIYFFFGTALRCLTRSMGCHY